jgi:hypothetical protein
LIFLFPAFGLVFPVSSEIPGVVVLKIRRATATDRVQTAELVIA